jgi:hypothetical protein
MGMQAYISREIEKNYDVTADHSIQLAKLIENASLGDDIHDAVWPLVADGDLPEALAQLSRVRNRLDTAIEDIAVAFSALEKRKLEQAAKA